MKKIVFIGKDVEDAKRLKEIFENYLGLDLKDSILLSRKEQIAGLHDVVYVFTKGWTFNDDDISDWYEVLKTNLSQKNALVLYEEAFYEDNWCS